MRVGHKIQHELGKNLAHLHHHHLLCLQHLLSVTLYLCSIIRRPKRRFTEQKDHLTAWKKEQKSIILNHYNKERN